MIWYRRNDGYGVCSQSATVPYDRDCAHLSKCDRRPAAYSVGRRVYQATVCLLELGPHIIPQEAVDPVLVKSLLVALGECIMGYV
jgi:hypothetical protein